MLSATPVNNRLADLRKRRVRFAFATEGDDTALAPIPSVWPGRRNWPTRLHQVIEQTQRRVLSGEAVAAQEKICSLFEEHTDISSIDATTRLAQKQFNRWLDLDDSERSTPSRLIEMLGFDYFALLDRLTIARSRRPSRKVLRNIGNRSFSRTTRYEAGRDQCQTRLASDLAGELGNPSIREINFEIRRLNLAAYAPLRYRKRVLLHKRDPRMTRSTAREVQHQTRER